MSSVSFREYPLSNLMPDAIRQRQILVRHHLIEAGLSDFAQEKANGRIHQAFDQMIAAQRLDTLRSLALHSLQNDAMLGCQLVRVFYHSRLDQYANALDPATVGIAGKRWVRCMQEQPELVAVWGLNIPVMVSYYNSSARWEARCDAIVAVDCESPHKARDLVRGLVGPGSSDDAPSWAWAGRVRTANTELASVFEPMQWDGGLYVDWDDLSNLYNQPTYDSLDEEDRAELLRALSETSVSERTIRLHRTEMAGGGTIW